MGPTADAGNMRAWSLQAVRRMVGTVEGSAACRPATKSAASWFRDALSRALRLGRTWWTCIGTL